MKAKFLKWFSRTALKNVERFNGALVRLEEGCSSNSIFDEEEIGRIGLEGIGTMLCSLVLGLLLLVFMPFIVLVSKNTYLNDEDYNEIIRMHDEILHIQES